MNAEKNYEGLKKYSKESNAFTRECLKQALIEVSREKTYTDISVTELCKKAGVSRMAFYRNYDVVNDIFKEIAADLNREVVDNIGSPFRDTTDRNWYIGVFNLVKRHRETMTLMLREDFQYEWMKELNKFTLHDKSFSVEKKFQRLLWSGAFEHLLSYWVNGGFKETPEELSEHCVKYLPHVEK